MKGHEAGVSLVEILVALLLMGIALVPLLHLYPSTLGFTLDSEYDMRLSAAAVRKSEELIGLLRAPATTIAFDASASRGSAGAQSSTSAAMTIGPAANNILILVGIQDDLAVSSVTVGGANAGLILARNHSVSERRSELWGLVNPPTGAVTVTVTLAGAAKHAWVAASFSGVQTGVPLGSSNGNDGNSLTPVVAIAPRTASTLMVGGFLWDFGGGTITQGSGQTAIDTVATTGAGGQIRTHLARETTPGSAGTDLAWTVSGASRDWIALAAELRSVSVAFAPSGTEACSGDLPNCLLVWTTSTEFSSGIGGVGTLRILTVTACEDSNGNGACDPSERQTRNDAKVTSRP